MKAVIDQDVYSSTRKSLRYAKKGDQVTIVADFINVAIVEDKTEIRFPVQKSQLTYETKTKLFD